MINDAQQNIVISGDYSGRTLEMTKRITGTLKYLENCGSFQYDNSGYFVYIKMTRDTADLDSASAGFSASSDGDYTPGTKIRIDRDPLDSNIVYLIVKVTEPSTQFLKVHHDDMLGHGRSLIINFDFSGLTLEPAQAG